MRSQIRVSEEDTIRYFIEAVRIVLVKFIRQGRMFPNQDASDAGLSIVAFNGVNEAGNER
jgi:hypothetical protein